MLRVESWLHHGGDPSDRVTFSKGGVTVDSLGQCSHIAGTYPVEIEQYNYHAGDFGENCLDTPERYMHEHYTGLPPDDTPVYAPCDETWVIKSNQARMVAVMTRISVVNRGKKQ